MCCSSRRQEGGPSAASVSVSSPEEWSPDRHCSALHAHTPHLRHNMLCYMHGASFMICCKVAINYLGCVIACNVCVHIQLHSTKLTSSSASGLASLCFEILPFRASRRRRGWAPRLSLCSCWPHQKMKRWNGAPSCFLRRICWAFSTLLLRPNDCYVWSLQCNYFVSILIFKLYSQHSNSLSFLQNTVGLKCSVCRTTENCCTIPQW